ncbi:MAG: DNA polymerase III subunit delta [Wenzhouxiangellaceae bacterium]|nr:MAG: DNA polymerase III subunit delta [Wenzhouxiangellaceae bacterium]
MKLFPEKLSTRLASQLDSLFLIAGPELLLVEEACDAVRQAARRAGIGERVVIEADGRYDWNQFGSASDNLSLFATRRLIELRLPSGKPGRDGAACLREWAAGDHDDVLLIKCQAWEMASEKTAWFRDVEKTGVFVPCWSVKSHRLPGWILARLRARGVEADESSAAFLAERLEGNLLAAAQEIERLALLYGQGSRLNLDQLKEAVADSARFDAFRLVELVLSGQAGASVRCIRGLDDGATPMPLIVGALARELMLLEAFQTLTRRMPAGRAMDELKVWPSRRGALEAAARRLQPGAVRLALARLSDLDRMAKSSQGKEFWLELERLCVALAGNRPALLGAA